MVEEKANYEDAGGSERRDEQRSFAPVADRPAGQRRVYRAIKRAETCVLIIGVVFLVIAYGRTRPLHDFVEYWTAAHQLAGGRNPYSAVQVLDLERRLGWSEPLPLMNPTPPWGLPLIGSVGLMRSYSAAWLAWEGVLIFVVWWSTKLLLNLYASGNRVFASESRGGEAIAGFFFFPTLTCLALAQITPFVLLGVVGFLWFEERQRPVLGGMCLALSAIKPHLVYLLWLALLFSSWHRKKWTSVFSVVGTLLLSTVVAVLMRPGVVVDYWAFLKSGYLRVFPSAVGAILRYSLGMEKAFLLQFVAPFLGTIWFLFYWRTQHDGWNWKEQMPILIIASVLTTSYGWTFDQIVLIVPMVAIAAGYVAVQCRVPTRIVLVFVALNATVLILRVLNWRVFLLLPVTFALALYTQTRNGVRPGIRRSPCRSEVA